MRRTDWAFIGVAVVVVATAAKKAKKVYVKEVSSGSRPIQAVGTAIAAFVGFDLH